MNKSRIEYENLIRDSILFALDKETQTIAYKREALKMVEYLYLYLTSINAEKYSKYGLEITQTANRCIKNYSADVGDFLNYFNSAIAKEYRKAYAQKHLSEQHGGVHIPEHEQRVIRKFIKLAETQGTYEFSDEMLNNMSEATGIKKERIVECLTAYQNSFVIADTYTNNEGAEESIFELIADDDLINKNIEETDDAIEFLTHINEVYKKRQERQKPLLSKLLTSKVALQVQGNDTLLAFAKTLSFFNQELYDEFCQQGEVPIAREIAVTFGLSEQSVSRTYKVFLSLL